MKKKVTSTKKKENHQMKNEPMKKAKERNKSKTCKLNAA
jgi:hypothetical protein